MNGQEKPLELLAMCAAVIVLSILGIAAGFSRELFGSLDGLLMLAACLMMALTFALLLFDLAKKQGWLRKRRQENGSEASSANGK
jgi:hypothetical protein